MLSISLFIIVIFLLMLGYPVAFTLSGVSLIFAIFCSFTNNFDLSLLYALPSRLFEIIQMKLWWQYLCLYLWELCLKNLKLQKTF